MVTNPREGLHPQFLADNPDIGKGQAEEPFAPYRGPLSDGVTTEIPPPEDTPPPFVQLVEGVEGFEELRRLSDEVMNSETTYRPGLLEDLQAPSFDEELDRELGRFMQLVDGSSTDDDDPPPSAPDSAVPWWMQDEDEEDDIAA